MTQEKLTKEKIQELQEQIQNMSHIEMAKTWRYAPAGHPFFRNDLPLFNTFKTRFQELGGMTPAISKAIG